MARFQISVKPSILLLARSQDIETNHGTDVQMQNTINRHLLYTGLDAKKNHVFDICVNLTFKF